PPPLGGEQLPRVPPPAPVPPLEDLVEAAISAAISLPPISAEPVSLEPVDPASQRVTPALASPITAPAFPAPGAAPKAPAFAPRGLGSIDDDEEERPVARVALVAPAG